MQQPLMKPVDFLGVSTAAGGDRLDALAFPLGQQPHRVERKRCPTFLAPQGFANPLQKPSETLLFLCSQFVVHEASVDCLIKAPAPPTNLSALADRRFL